VALVTAFTLAFGWIAWQRRLALEQSRAVASIRASGGWVRYAYQEQGLAAPLGPAWLRERLICSTGW
jgi:hypothetical protein